ncbi:MAG TPA: hypothetical protein PLR60_11220 [Syntrophorhabdaceae bacterium]|nr:hypothetical protein [Syntrophorhabdaceae bacterium]
MKKTLIVLFAGFIVLVFACNPAVSADTPVKVDATKMDSTKKKNESKEIKGKTEKNVPKTTVNALGETAPKSSIPIGKSTNALKQNTR